MEVLKFAPDDFSNEFISLKFAKLINNEAPPQEPMIFHCYWMGQLNEKHLISIKSCYLFNVRDRKNKIILWTQNVEPNNVLCEIKKYAEVREFNENDECQGTFMEDYTFNAYKNLAYISDAVRSILLYKYGGIWFDLDCLFLRNFHPLLNQFPGKILVYRWENQNYPNNAIYISPTPRCEKMKANMAFIHNRGRGWGFQQAGLIFDMPLDIFVLPCPWFDAGWIENPVLHFDRFFKASEAEFTLDNFFPGAFCFHWHNKWLDPIEPSSPMDRLAKDIDRRLSMIGPPRGA